MGGSPGRFAGLTGRSEEGQLARLRHRGKQA